MACLRQFSRHRIVVRAAEHVLCFRHRVKPPFAVFSALTPLRIKGRMKIPKRLQPLVDDGLIDEVLYPLMSGKEAAVFVVRCGEAIRCAKVYKDAAQRSFKKAVTYREGRKDRSSRRA